MTLAILFYLVRTFDLFSRYQDIESQFWLEPSSLFSPAAGASLRIVLWPIHDLVHLLKRIRPIMEYDNPGS